MSSKLARSAGLIGIATMASRMLGVVREMVLAALFGAGTSMDAFNVAFRIPNLVRDLFAEGAVTAAFLPTFTRTLHERGRDEAWRLGSLVVNALLLVTGAFVLLGILFAGPITQAIASGDEFAAVPGKLELTTRLTRIMLPFVMTVAVAVPMMGMLNSLHRFFVPALSPAMFNVATITCALAVVPLMPRVGLPPIAGIAFGTLLGGFGQIALQWPVLKKEGFRYRAVLDFTDPGLREVLRLMGPGTLGLAAVQLNVFVNIYLATTQPEGAVSWLGYAFRLMYLPIGLFGVSIATAALPDISRHAAAGDTPEIRRAVSSALRLMLMLNVPATIGLMVLAQPIVAFLLERHAFTAVDTQSTAAALICYAPGLSGYSVVKIASPTFYALRDSRTPAVIAILSVAANLGINLVLVRVLGFRGLALGTALSATFNAAALLWLLDRRLGGIEGGRIATATLKIMMASTLMGVAAWSTSHWLTPAIPAGSVAVSGMRLAAAIAAGVAVLAGSARLLRIAEFEEAVRRVIHRLKPGA
jgi:putative peptidoglycan lipid II flippase